MTRNLKAMGLVLVAALALSAVVASAASAEAAKFTAAVGATEVANIHGEQIGTTKITIGSVEVTCATATVSGQALFRGTEFTEVTLTTQFITCHAIVSLLGTKVTRTATFTMNGCSHKLNATKNTAGTAFSADLTIECPGSSKIEIHVYNNSAHMHSNVVLCTYDIGPQTVNDQIQLTNGATDIVADQSAVVAITNTIPNTTCSTSNSAVFEGEDTLRGTNEAGVIVPLSVS